MVKFVREGVKNTFFRESLPTNKAKGREALNLLKSLPNNEKIILPPTL